MKGLLGKSRNSSRDTMLLIVHLSSGAVRHQCGRDRCLQCGARLSGARLFVRRVVTVHSVYGARRPALAATRPNEWAYRQAATRTAENFTKSNVQENMIGLVIVVEI